MVEISDEAITSMITMCQQPTSTLFDSSLTFSYVLLYVASHLGVSPKPPSSLVCVLTLVGDSLVVNQVCRACIVTF